MSDRGYEGWRRNFYTLWAAELTAIIGFQAMQPFLPYYIQEFDVEDLTEALVWAGRMGTSAGLAMAVSAPIWGTLADRHGRKPMVVRSMLGGGLCVVLMAYVPSVEWLLLARVLQGVLAGTVTACLTLVSTSTPRSHLAFALGLMQGAFMLGASVGPLIGGPMIEAFGYRNCFLVSGGLVVLAGLCVQLRVREDFSRSRSLESSSRYRLPGRDMVRLLSMRPFLVLVATVTSMSFAFGFIMPVVPLFLQRLAEGRDILSLAGLIFGLAGLVGAVSSAVMGRFSDRLGPRRVLVGGLWSAGVLYLGQGFSTTVWALGMLVILNGVATGSVRPVANAVLTRIIDEEDRGKAFGVMSSMAALGWALGPLAGSYLGAELGFRSVFYTTSVLFLIVGGWVGLATSRDRKGWNR